MCVLISVIIPIYNVDKYLSKCLDTVCKQTLSEIEIICVDDGSTDSSLDILNEYSKVDKRILILQQENSGAGVARNLGLAHASGKYVVFMDPDDWYPSNDVLETMYGYISKSNVLIAGGSLDFYDSKRNEIVPNKIPKAIFFKNVIIDFNEYQYDYFFMRYIYSIDIFKKYGVSFSELRRYQDVIFLLNVMDVCKELLTFPEVVYVYRGNNHNVSFYTIEKALAWMEGIYRALVISSKNNWVTIHYETVMRLTYDNFLEATGELRNSFDKRYISMYSKILSAIDINLLKIKNYNIDLDFPYYAVYCKSYFWDLLYNPSIADKDKYLKSVMNCLTPTSFLKALVYNYLGDSKTIGAISRLIQQNKINKKIKTIGIFNEALNFGGVERCITLFIPIFKKLGYNIVLFTESHPSEDKFDIPPDIKRIVLPGIEQKNKKQWLSRVDILRDELISNHIDLMYYHSYWKINLIIDILICKELCHIPFLLHRHNVFSAMLARNNDLFYEEINFYRLTDCVISLSTVDQTYYRMNNVASTYLPNPVEPIDFQSNPDGNTILWVGRFVENHKQPMEALKIMSLVVKKVPDVKLYMVGDGDPSVKQRMYNYIQQHNLESNVIFTGFITNVDAYYDVCKLLLLTSCIEGFPMVVAESKTHGLPLVVYDLPYVEMIRDGAGLVVVKQGDYVSAANSIVHLLNDEKYRQVLSKDAINSLSSYSIEDLIGLWKNVFNYLESGCYSDLTYLENSPDDFKILVETLTYHTQLSKVPRGSVVLKKTKNKFSNEDVRHFIKNLFSMLKYGFMRLVSGEYKLNSVINSKYDEMVNDNWLDYSTIDTTHVDFIFSVGVGMKVKYHIKHSTGFSLDFPLDEMSVYSLTTLLEVLAVGPSLLFTNYQVCIEGEQCRIRDTDRETYSQRFKNLNDGDVPQIVENLKVKELKKHDLIVDIFSDNVSCLFLTCNRKDINEIITFSKKIHELFSNVNFTILLIENYPELDEKILYRTIYETDNVHVKRVAMNDCGESGDMKWIGNVKSWATILKKYNTRLC